MHLIHTALTVSSLILLSASCTSREAARSCGEQPPNAVVILADA